MESLEPRPGFYDKFEYGVYEKQLLHHGTVRVLIIYIYNNHISLIKRHF